METQSKSGQAIRGMLERIRSGIANIQVTKPLHGYESLVTRYPWMDMVLKGTAGAGGAYLGLDRAARGMLPGMAAMAGEDPQTYLDVWKNEMGGLRAGAAGLGGLAGAGYSTLNRGTPGERFSSMLKGRDPKDAPAREAYAQGVLAKRREDAGRKTDIKGLTQAFTWGDKLASGLDDAVMDRQVPISYVTTILHNDPFLKTREKNIAEGILQKTVPGGRGMTTADHIMRTAARAGFGWTVGGKLAEVASNIAGIPPQDIGKYRTGGAIAAAVYNTGLFDRK